MTDPKSKGGDIHLRDAFFNIQVLQQSGIDTVLRGASLQQAQEVDSQYTDSLRNFLFAAPPEEANVRCGECFVLLMEHSQRLTLDHVIFKEVEIMA